MVPPPPPETPPPRDRGWSSEEEAPPPPIKREPTAEPREPSHESAEPAMDDAPPSEWETLSEPWSEGWAGPAPDRQAIEAFEKQKRLEDARWSVDHKTRGTVWCSTEGCRNYLPLKNRSGQNFKGRYCEVCHVGWC